MGAATRWGWVQTWGENPSAHQAWQVPDVGNTGLRGLGLLACPGGGTWVPGLWDLPFQDVVGLRDQGCRLWSLVAAG